MRRSKRIKRWAVYRLALLAMWLLNRLPRAASQAFGAGFGRIAWRFLPRERRNIDRHLDLAYGSELTPADRTGIGRRFFINSGKNLADFIRLRDHFQDELATLVTIEGLQHYHDAFKAGRGVIGVTGHIGNWEMLAARLAMEGHPVAVIAREMYDPRLDRLLVGTREALGVKNVPTTASPRVLLEWLKNNGIIGVLIDTDSMRVRSEFVDWFGRPANTPIGQSLLGLRAGAAFIPAVCLRRPGNKYHIVIREQVRVEETGDREADALRLTQACVRELETIITAHKDQWIWLHNRWNTRPGPTKSA